jgi:hypothetical protein
VNEAKAQNARTILRDDDDVVFRLGDSQEKENIPDYVDSSPPLRNLRSLVDTSDVGSDAGSTEKKYKCNSLRVRFVVALCAYLAKRDTCFRRLQAIAP